MVCVTTRFELRRPLYALTMRRMRRHIEGGLHGTPRAFRCGFFGKRTTVCSVTWVGVQFDRPRTAATCPVGALRLSHGSAQPSRDTSSAS